MKSLKIFNLLITCNFKMLIYKLRGVRIRVKLKTEDHNILITVSVKQRYKK